MSQLFRLSANISMLFAERPFLDRIEAAAQAGFAAVECHFPYAFDPLAARARIADHGLVMNGINTPPGDMAAGEFGMAAIAGGETRFRAEFDQALAWARAAGVGSIHVMSGAPTGAPEAARATFLANMAWAGARAPEMTLLIEPLNTRDRPGYFVSRSDEVAALLRELDRPNVKLMFDIYHIQAMEGDLLRRLERHWAVIGHVQLASAPERREPDEGEIATPAILDALIARGWDKFVAAEYKPRANTEAGLGWAKPYLARR